MQAIGKEVFLALAPIALSLVFVLYSYRQQILQIINRVNLFIFGAQRRDVQIARPHIFGDRQCCICLMEPKSFEVAGTCGHSFCCPCIFSLYERTHQKIQCPLCRKQITTVFTSFTFAQTQQEQSNEMKEKVDAYNMRFEDNRSLVRIIQQFPYMLRRIGRYVFSMEFWILFIRRGFLFRFIFAAIFYILLPFDIIPERLFGVIGFIDDLFILIFLTNLALVIFLPIYIRLRR